MGAIENGMVVGADDIQTQRQRINDRIDELTEQCLAEFYEDDGSVEEAIGQNADLVLVAVKALRADGDAAKFLAAFDVAVASHLEPEARNWANREIYIERGLA